MSIVVNNITKTYGAQKALDNVSFSINKGDIVGFLGPNGAGKSTMMKIITGFIPPTSGSIAVNGLDVVNESLKIRKITGYLPEHNPHYLDMYIKEYLEFVAGIYKLDNRKKRIADIIEKTGLVAEQRKKIGALSKGYRQRVGLAQALIHNPQVLILDEPTTGLDPNQIVEIRKLISEFGREKTVMLSTHIMQEVEAICDHVIIVNKGRIVANDKAENLQLMSVSRKQTIVIEVLEDFDHSYLYKIEGVAKVTPVKNNKIIVYSDSEKDLRPEIFRFAVEKNLTLLTLNAEEKKLENVFRELTQSLINAN